MADEESLSHFDASNADPEKLQTKIPRENNWKSIGPKVRYKYRNTRIIHIIMIIYE